MTTKGVEVMKKLMNIVLDQALVDGIEEYRKRQPGEVPSKAAAIRELLALALRVDAEEIASEPV
jgi:hypothetical protein